MNGDLITTPADRLRYMEKVRKWDIEWKREHGGNLPREEIHYENIGDIASVNTCNWHPLRFPLLDVGLAGCAGRMSIRFLSNILADMI